MNTTQTRCPACHVTIDSAAADAAATTLATVDQACSDADYAKIVLITLLGAVPFALAAIIKLHVGLLFRAAGALGLNGTAEVMYFVAVLEAIAMFGVLGMVARWRIRFGSNPSTDEGFLAAKRKIVFTGVVALGLIVAVGVVTLLLRHH